MSIAKFNRTPNSLKKLLSIPCTIPYWVAGELAVASIVKAIGAFFHPDFKELYHLTSGQTFNHSVHGVIAEGIEADSTVLNGFGRFVAKFNAFADVAAWDFYLAGLGKDALIDFVTQAHRQPECLPNAKPHTGLSETPFLAVPFGSFGPAWEWFGNGILDPAGYPTWEVAPGHKWYQALHGSGTDGIGNPFAVVLIIMRDDDGVVLDFDMGAEKESGGFYSTAVFTGGTNNYPDYSRYTVYGMGVGGPPDKPCFCVGGGYNVGIF